MKYCLIILVFFPTMIYSQTPEQIIRTGNEFFRKGELASAEKEYDKVSTDPRATFNKGIALYKQSKKEEAQKSFTAIATDNDDASMRAKSFYNQGVIFSSDKKLEESIEAYKNALRNDPNDMQARENLQKALSELKRRSPKKPPEKKKQQQKPPPQPKMNPKQTQQKLQQLQQKEKQTQEKIRQKQPISQQPKDW